MSFSKKVQTQKNQNYKKDDKWKKKLNLYKNSNKISDQIIDEICTDVDLKKNDEIIDILLSKNEKNINEFISNMSNYEKNFIEIIIILRSFIIKILDIQKSNKNLSIDAKIEKYKPPIFWKDKDRIKNILKIWNTNNLEKLRKKTCSCLSPPATRFPSTSNFNMLPVVSLPARTCAI